MTNTNPSESTDFKLDARNEPSAHLIEENVALPEDMFKSYWSYLLYEVVRYKPIMVFVLIKVSLILFGVIFHDNEDCVGFSMLFLFFTLLISIYPVTLFWLRVNDRDFEIELLVEVIARKPAVKGKEWRTITYKMNRYLFNEGKWNTPYYFYCEESCHRYFLRLIEGRTFQKQPATGTPNEGPESFTFQSGPDLQKLLSKAAEIEQQSQHNYWRVQYPEIDAHS
ncbi:DUP/COS family protein SKDI_01G0880 [Saccharomyces kudriavzevii IFO 1802]|uniref:PRM9-like protein n=2 Tax=Saccharomyces kudriavzevii (strain ATCC MYA-4449 / AS 2.2408 / CBS 8840 / NBRC 1802 / NCYC 2889) TaxID=226230 RepID=J6EJU4_SACK1|nr:uncharacterized protein SKDI_01G0880 [Saccharomyces kudriavzevii IFO 1802]EJT43497.1 PRM9-like protein [Saccharomyces kudriavzevii IFO 1802]CAI4054670.1 hypothetical protein SKDI_01G0880 [Saccharomyces kudriavzevii IFO 1802]